MNEQVSLVRQYHTRTKHQLKAYARGPEFIDWENQPNLFRYYDKTEKIKLPLLDNTAQSFSHEITLSNIAALLELSFGLSCWKQYGPDRWPLRCNPSSGNLHPTEAYLITSSIVDLEDGIYHYTPLDHGLEKRAQCNIDKQFSQCLIALSSIVWREAWKYGERAYRYVQLDIGHALGALSFAAKALGLQIRYLPVNDHVLDNLLGLNRKDEFYENEYEQADVLIQIFSGEEKEHVILPQIKQYYGHANHLAGSPEHHWKILDRVSYASRCNSEISFKHNTDFKTQPGIDNIFSADPVILKKLIKQRRSAQAFYGKKSYISKMQFYQLLDALLPRYDLFPWKLLASPGFIHLVIFIHRVEDIEPGIYILARNIQRIPVLKAAMHPDFLWQKQLNPFQLPLFQLIAGDQRKVARSMSCYQEIASSSAFTIAMLTEFDKALNHGSNFYRRMHWEAGLIGQIIYLQAEYTDKRGTGIGCFFDDEMHKLLGLTDTQLQIIYHFTMGQAIIDERIQTISAYAQR